MTHEAHENHELARSPETRGDDGLVVRGQRVAPPQADVFDARAVDDYARRLRSEFAPATASAEILVELAARSAAGLVAAEAIEAAIMRQAASRFAALGEAGVTGHDGDRSDQILAATMSSEILDRGMRFRRGHLRGLLDALSMLTNERGTRSPRIIAPNPEECHSEEFCHTYLERRLRRGDYRCPVCGGRRGSWLASRHRWECGACHRQHGPRAGTVMARSPLPLVPWFAAIRAIVNHPRITTAELARVIQIARLATVRAIATKIRHAQAGEHASQLLAGLDVYFRTRQTRT